MKYLLVAHYAGFDLDDTEDLVNNSWIVGEAMTETEAIDLATKEIENYIEEQIDNRFDENEIDPSSEYYNEEAAKEAKEFRDTYEISITDIRIPSDKMETVATLYKNGEYYFEDLKIEVVKL